MKKETKELISKRIHLADKHAASCSTLANFHRKADTISSIELAKQLDIMHQHYKEVSQLLNIILETELGIKQCED